MAKICLVEKDDSVRMLLEMALRSSGHDPRCFVDSQSALEEMRRNPPQACVVGSMVQREEGAKLLRDMRKIPVLERVPVMILTGRNEKTGEVEGADGADDYVIKPFGVLEICARLRNMLQKGKQRNGVSAELVAGPLRLRPGKHEAILNGRAIGLTHKEYDLLYTLMSNAGRAVSREELLRDVWGYTYIGESRTLDMHVGTLRQKLGDNPNDPIFIKTVRSVGYRFIARVKIEEVGSAG